MQNGTREVQDSGMLRGAGAETMLIPAPFRIARCRSTRQA